MEDGSNSMIGAIKATNTEAAILDSVSILVFNDKLYVRHYDLKSKQVPFEVYDPQTLLKDEKESARIEELFKQIQ